MPDTHGYGALGASAELQADADAQDLLAATTCTGRSTLFCCLACGMPYAFPDNAYMSADQQVREVLLFVHKVRHEVRKQDNNKASTMQWQVGRPNRCAHPPAHEREAPRAAAEQVPLRPQVPARQPDLPHLRDERGALAARRGLLQGGRPQEQAGGSRHRVLYFARR